jgi:uncharacterized Ntn-hydrolase superfamily protein
MLSSKQKQYASIHDIQGAEGEAPGEPGAAVGVEYDTYLSLVILEYNILTIDINTMTKEEALRRFKAAKQTKKDAVAALEQKMKQDYEERTGLKANYVVTL